jgi:hypothetical protein
MWNKLLLFSAFLLFLYHPALADACKRDCNKACCSKVLGKRICEPVCKSSCEATKATCQVTGGSVRLPGIPSPVVVVQQLLTQSCAAAFDSITKGVIFGQGFNAAGSNLPIEEARALLIQAQLFDPSEFNNVTIRWCRLNNASGMAPDRNIICLSEGFWGEDTTTLAILLAHEMTHIRQYRSKGTDEFKCLYSQEYVRCGGCQNMDNTYEADAYRFEDHTKEVLQTFSQSKSQSTRSCITSEGNCSISALATVGFPCYCISDHGQVWGTTAD